MKQPFIFEGGIEEIADTEEQPYTASQLWDTSEPADRETIYPKVGDLWSGGLRIIQDCNGYYVVEQMNGETVTYSNQYFSNLKLIERNGLTGEDLWETFVYGDCPQYRKDELDKANDDGMVEYLPYSSKAWKRIRPGTFARVWVCRYRISSERLPCGCQGTPHDGFQRVVKHYCEEHGNKQIVMLDRQIVIANRSLDDCRDELDLRIQLTGELKNDFEILQAQYSTLEDERNKLKEKNEDLLDRCQKQQTDFEKLDDECDIFAIKYKLLETEVVEAARIQEGREQNHVNDHLLSTLITNDLCPTEDISNQCVRAHDTVADCEKCWKAFINENNT